MKLLIFAAILALTPALLHAQATTPAQTANLQARLAPPAALKATEPNNFFSNRPVSTGVVAPQQTQPLNLTAPTESHLNVASQDVTVVVSMVVNASGRPGELAIIQSGGTTLDQEVLQAMSHYSFVPAKLDGENIAVPMQLSVFVPRGTEY